MARDKEDEAEDAEYAAEEAGGRDLKKRTPHKVARKKRLPKIER